MLLLTLSFVPPITGQTLAQSKTLHVSMPTRQGALFAPYNIALDKGYFKDEGLDLDIRIAGGGVATPAQIAGDIDINTSGPAAIIPIMRGARLKLVYTLATHSTDQIWSTSHAIKTFQDLQGKQVGVLSRGDTNEIGVRMALLKSGLSSDWVSYTALGELGNVLAVMKTAALPAVVLGGVSVELAREAGSLEKGNLLYDEAQELEMPYNSIAVSDRFLGENRRALEGFLRATLKAARYMKKYNAPSVAIMRKYDSASSEKVLKADYDRLYPVLSLDGTVPEDARLTDLKVRASLIDLPESKIPALAQVYDYSIVRSVNAQLDASGWTPSP
jgi:ABC-type nitrate/sulfonate/bicarbonate transport system substrate-binding protein